MTVDVPRYHRAQLAPQMSIDEMLIYHARVSVPENKRNLPGEKLIAYLLEHHHVSPFDMANIVISVVTTRDIGRQMLRHWSLKPQEFSQRYADPTTLGGPVFREARLQDDKNRQQSVDIDDSEFNEYWQKCQREVWDVAERNYIEARNKKMAREVARAILPEGMTPTRMDFNGSIRSWLFFCDLRTRKNGAQKEIEFIAQDVWEIMRQLCPITVKAWEDLRAKKELDAKKIAFVDWLRECPSTPLDGEIYRKLAEYGL